jgi:hypothetical protein
LCGDAIFSQKNLHNNDAKKANYLFRIKDNHRAVRREIAQQFAIKPSSSVTEHSRGHGREEVKTLGAMAVLECLTKWTGTE